MDCDMARITFPFPQQLLIKPSGMTSFFYKGEVFQKLEGRGTFQARLKVTYLTLYKHPWAEHTDSIYSRCLTPEFASEYPNYFIFHQYQSNPGKAVCIHLGALQKKTKKLPVANLTCFIQHRNVNKSVWICLDPRLCLSSPLLSSTFPLSRAHIKQWTSEPAISKDQSGWWSRETLLIIYTLSCVAGSPRKSQTHSFISASNGRGFCTSLCCQRDFSLPAGRGFWPHMRDTAAMILFTHSK